MKKRSLGIFIITIIAASLFVAGGIYAATKVPAEVQMKSDYKHKKSIAVFTHQKHVNDYEITCGECHHDDQGKPLNNLKEGDDVQNCFECHKKPGELKGKKAKGLSKKEKREYHGNAVHENCLGCHRKYNKEKKTKAAPTKCTACHPKKKKK